MAATLSGATLAACAPSSEDEGSEATGQTSAASPTVEIDQNFDLDELVEAAQAEGKKLTVYDSTGAVEDIAANFEKKYGIETEGIKSDAPDTVEKMIREAQADNVTVDVAVISDIASIVNELFPQEVATNWIPPDLADTIPQKNPLVAVVSPSVFVYNNETYPDECPISNIWELTEDEWQGNFAMGDPLNEPDLTDWFSELTIRGADDLEGAYASQYDETLETSEENAAWEWIKRLGENQPKIFADEETLVASVGVRGQDDPPIGLMSVAKFRDLEDKDYALEICEVSPWVGYAYPKSIVMATGTEAPNSAKLWIHYMMTAEGIEPQVSDGKISGNSDVPLAADDPSGVSEYLEDLLVFGTDTAQANGQIRPDMQDFWRLSYSG
ncbi:ABC transporter substrate-binding protein [Nocardioides sp. YIM 152315]|uniref:ABC transporter substrate-binding protein n=1 Tax=Nocardioides sp. YIM 152315 TaxID=3031760 RepID=UPI0023DB3718|nr:ABC transporter substrate-binding protein [Nocardioides sp. YIM 152315]MDF1605482.1 ABC transporter substrate-binding protein [Nocardioides sp. YIM 152315]